LIISYYKGAPIKIKDIGKAEDGYGRKRSLARSMAYGHRNQIQSIGTIQLPLPQVRKEVERINETLPRHETQYRDGSINFIVRSIDEVQGHLILGSLFAVFAVFLFLKNMRTTLISAVASNPSHNFHLRAD